MVTRTVECPCSNDVNTRRGKVRKRIVNILISVQSVQPIGICADEFHGPWVDNMSLAEHTIWAEHTYVPL
jgi:hypothetical protein